MGYLYLFGILLRVSFVALSLAYATKQNEMKRRTENE